MGPVGGAPQSGLGVRAKAAPYSLAIVACPFVETTVDTAGLPNGTVRGGRHVAPTACGQTTTVCSSFPDRAMHSRQAGAVKLDNGVRGNQRTTSYVAIKQGHTPPWRG